MTREIITENIGLHIVLGSPYGKCCPEIFRALGSVGLVITIKIKIVGPKVWHITGLSGLGHRHIPRQLRDLGRQIRKPLCPKIIVVHDGPGDHPPCVQRPTQAYPTGFFL